MVKFSGEKGREAQKFPWKQFTDPELKRIFKSLTNLGVAALSPARTAEMIKLNQDMESNHAKAKVCPYRKPEESPAKPEDCTLALEPEIKQILEESNDYDELLHVWSQFRDKAGKPVKDKWMEVANILNEGARANGRKVILPSDTNTYWHIRCSDLYHNDHSLAFIEIPRHPDQISSSGLESGVTLKQYYIHI